MINVGTYLKWINPFDIGHTHYLHVNWLKLSLQEDSSWLWEMSCRNLETGSYQIFSLVLSDDQLKDLL